MKKLGFAVAASMAMSLGMTNAARAADVLDFETGSISAGGVYSQNGYTVTVQNFTGGNAALQSSQNPGNNSRIFAFCSINGPCTQGTSFSITSSAGVFSLASFGAANWRSEAALGSIDLVGQLFGGGQVTQTVSIANLWQTYNPSLFTNLTSLSFSSRDVYAGDIDNVNLIAGATNAVPEPSTWALMLLGFGAIGFTMRRRAQPDRSIRFA